MILVAVKAFNDKTLLDEFRAGRGYRQKIYFNRKADFPGYKKCVKSLKWDARSESIKFKYSLGDCNMIAVQDRIIIIKYFIFAIFRKIKGVPLFLLIKIF